MCKAPSRFFFSSRRVASNMVTLKSQVQNLTPGQGHLVTQVGHVAYQSMRQDKTDTLTHIPLSVLSKVTHKKRIDLMKSSDDLSRDYSCKIATGSSIIALFIIILNDSNRSDAYERYMIFPH